MKAKEVNGDWTTIRISPVLIRSIRIFKADLGFNTYDEAIHFLLNQYKGAAGMENCVK